MSTTTVICGECGGPADGSPFHRLNYTVCEKCAEHVSTFTADTPPIRIKNTHTAPKEWDEFPCSAADAADYARSTR